MMNSIDYLTIAYNAILDKMGFDITLINIEDISSLSEYFIIASANNSNQLRSIMEELQKKFIEVGFKVRHIEGLESLRWILLDFGHIIVHLFLKDEREYYRLDKLWADGKILEFSDL